MKKQIKTKTVRGYWGECFSCGQHLPLHPDLDLCGCCAFGEADAMFEFDGEWEVEIEPVRRAPARPDGAP